jgi:cell wall-associated NlpC family hydrolase
MSVRRRLLLALTVLSLAAGAQPASAKNWADSQIRQVLGHGLLPGVTRGSFHPTQTLDNGTLAMLVWGAIPDSISSTSIPTSSDPVTIGDLDATFVSALGLDDAATQAELSLQKAGYHPRPDAGTEIVARLLGLRYNHPASADRLELSDMEPANRAEAAYTTAVVLAGPPIAYARAIVAKMQALPQTTGWRHDAIDRAIGLIGQPYVWGGTWENATGGPYGPQAHGGFDCSGLVWRVMALDPASWPGAGRLLGGRTTYQMARTTHRHRRLRGSRVHPGDVLLFSPLGRKAHWQDVSHTGINIGAGLMIHSSSEGVTIKEWDTGYHHTAFVFAKSVLP